MIPSAIVLHPFRVKLIRLDHYSYSYVYCQPWTTLNGMVVDLPPDFWHFPSIRLGNCAREEASPFGENGRPAAVQAPETLCFYHHFVR
jgi:hypothetical protein